MIILTQNVHYKHWLIREIELLEKKNDIIKEKTILLKIKIRLEKRENR